MKQTFSFVTSCSRQKFGCLCFKDNDNGYMSIFGNQNHNGFLSKSQQDSTTVVPVSERSDLACDSDAIRVFVPEAILPHVNGRNVTWREDSCALQYNGSHYVGSVLLSDCGTTVTIEEDNVTFTNEIIIHKSGNDVNVQSQPGNDDVTFGEDYETVVPVECIYPREYLLYTDYKPVKQHIRFFEKRYGELELAMQQFESEKYETVVECDLASPRQVPLDSDVFVRIGLKFDPQDLKLDAKKCIATTTSSPADAKWHPLVENGCPKGETRILSGDNSSDVRFAFKAFDFRQDSTGFVYIHCGVTMCGVNDAVCQTGCQSRNKRSAGGGIRQGSHLVSMGPFVVKGQDGSSGAPAVGLPIVFAAVCLMVAVVAVVVAIIGWRRQTTQDNNA